MAVIQAGSMGKAAARFNLTQPAVSKVIADLENTLGVRLLDRSRQGVEATPHGLALIKRGVAVFDELRQGVQDLDYISDPTAGEIRVGSTEAIAAAIVAPVIDRLSRRYPRMAFHVVAGDMAVLDRELAERNVELAISRMTAPVAEEYSAEILFHDSSAIATGAKNPLTRRRKIALPELMNEPWLLSPMESYYGSFQAEVFRARGLAPPRLAVSTLSINLRNELLATGRFLAIVPGFHLRLPRPHPFLRTLPVELPDTRVPIAITTLKNRAPSSAAQLFIEHVRAITKPLAKVY
jgi:DNA-binding transcriptional LysR family regulator